MGRNNKTIIYGLLPFINGDLFNLPSTLSSMHKVISGILTICVVLLYCIINIIGYFSCLYIIKHTELEKKYPKLSPIIKYYEKTSIIFLVIEIISVILILLIAIGLCVHLLYIL
jgi:hypothetical protein